MGLPIGEGAFRVRNASANVELRTLNEEAEGRRWEAPVGCGGIRVFGVPQTRRRGIWGIEIAPFEGNGEKTATNGRGFMRCPGNC